MINETILTLGNSSSINVVLQSQTNWSQYAISIAIGGLMTLYFLWQIVKGSIGAPIEKARLLIYKYKTGRDVILIKHNIDGLFSSNMVSRQDYQKIAEILAKLKGKSVDIILHTPGGEMFAAMMISRLLQDYPGEKRAIIPTYAMSAGTIIALSCDEIAMSDSASLGPVDPQIGMLWNYGSANSWKALRSYKGKKVSDQSYIMAMIARQAENETRQLIEPLIVKHTGNRSFTKDFVAGQVLHSHQFTPDKLLHMGFNIRKISRKETKMLLKILSCKTSESIASS